MWQQYTLKYNINKQIKPLPLKDRKTVDLSIGELYYVSLGGSIAYQCELLDIIESEDSVMIRCGRMLKIIKKYEIGATPMGAILNQVTYD